MVDSDWLLGCGADRQAGNGAKSKRVLNLFCNWRAILAG